MFFLGHDRLQVSGRGEGGTGPLLWAAGIRVTAAEILWLDGESSSDGRLVRQQQPPADGPLHDDVVSEVQQQRRGVLVIRSGANTKGQFFLHFFFPHLTAMQRCYKAALE